MRALWIALSLICLAMACSYVVVMFSPSTVPKLVHTAMWPVISHEEDVRGITQAVRAEYALDDLQVDVRSTSTASYTDVYFMDALFWVPVPGFKVRYRPSSDTPFVEFRTTGVRELRAGPERLLALPSMVNLTPAEYTAVLREHTKQGGVSTVAGAAAMGTLTDMLVRREGKEYAPSRCFCVVPVRRPSADAPIAPPWLPPGDALVYYLDDNGTVTVLGKMNDLMVMNPR